MLIHELRCTGARAAGPWMSSILELQPTHLAVCFDAKGKTFRHEMFSDYKANRKPTPPELAEVIPGVIDMVQRMGVPLLMMSGVEADDIIGTIARRSVGSADGRTRVQVIHSLERSSRSVNTCFHVPYSLISYPCRVMIIPVFCSLLMSDNVNTSIEA